MVTHAEMVEMAKKWIALFSDGRALCAKDDGVTERGVWWDDAAGSTGLAEWNEVEVDLVYAKRRGG